MAIHFNLFIVVLLFGIIQGLTISCTLLLKGRDHGQARYFLSVFLLVLTYNSFGTFCWSSGLHLSWFFLFDRIFPYTILLTAGPSLYLYIRSIANGEAIPTKIILKTYAPAFADLILRLLLWSYGLQKTNLFYHPVALSLMVLIFWSYLLSAMRLFKNIIPKNTEQKLAEAWTRIFLIVLAGVACLWTITIFGTVLFQIRTLAFFEPIEITLVIFVYWIGLKSYHGIRVVYIEQQRTNLPTINRFLPDEAAYYIKLLSNAMIVDRLYLDPELSTEKLASTLGLNVKLVSAILNGYLNKGFNGFVNEFRVEAVKVQLLDPACSHLSNLGIALNCGFKSEATFHRVFKSLTGLSPSAFRQNNDLRISP